MDHHLPVLDYRAEFTRRVWRISVVATAHVLLSLRVSFLSSISFCSVLSVVLLHSSLPPLALRISCSLVLLVASLPSVHTRTVCGEYVLLFLAQSLCLSNLTDFRLLFCRMYSPLSFYPIWFSRYLSSGFDAPSLSRGVV